ncbi:MAG: nucleotidyltransferase family protein [Halioglobus sp.]|nr:nucleotidyltransferase family protein [Halioglobus sp.]
MLAAGKGSRMTVFSEQFPKPMLPVGNKPLLVHQIELLRDIGIRDIVVLIGYKGFEIVRVLGDGSRFGVRLTYVEQNEALGIAHAVGQLESAVCKPFILFLGDIFFVAKNLEHMFDQFEQQGEARFWQQRSNPILWQYGAIIPCEWMIRTALPVSSKSPVMFPIG